MDEVKPESKEPRNACSACGASPVNHTVAFFTQSIEAWLDDRLLPLRSSAMYRRLDLLTDRWLESLLPPLVSALHALRIVRFSRDQERANTYRSQVIWEEASRRGIVMEQVVFLGATSELYRARIGTKTRYFQSLPIPSELRVGMYPGLDDKYLFKALLHKNGIASPRAIRVSTRKEAEKAYQELQKPLVVKPRIGTRARHTTTNIFMLEDLFKAFDRAKVLCREGMVEEYLEGGVCRATVVNGVVVGFLQMLPARVTGDGIHSISELVDEKNRTRPERVKEVVIDAEHREYLGRLGYALDSVLEKGKTIALSRRTGRFEGGETRELPQEIHPNLRRYIERAAHVLQAIVVGFDLIIPDPTADPDTQRWGILEGNSLPFIDLHYLPLYGHPSNVAAAVWDLWPQARLLKGSKIVHEEQVLSMGADLVRQSDNV
ncbi:MAG: hypothetical protein P4L81_07270 [Candidatus Pacebacteria bacterium]|nr:hypothetical protein [Candidatus Paceibacterota bacterium]